LHQLVVPYKTPIPLPACNLDESDELGAIAHVQYMGMDWVGLEVSQPCWEHRWVIGLIGALWVVPQ
jgi:hypothetical protein